MNDATTTTAVKRERYDLPDQRLLFATMLPDELVPRATEFEALWVMHPLEYHEIKIHGRLVRTPRWQQAYGVDYRYTGRVNRALPIPQLIAPYLEWARKAIDQRLNGVLINWYDGALGHYIGRHRDSTTNLVPDVPIVTISFGEERVFRLRPWRTNPNTPVDFRAANGTVFVMPFETNLTWTHEVPAFRNSRGCRISLTFRAFHTESKQPADACIGDKSCYGIPGAGGPRADSARQLKL
jgi:alkylated DNA repair dioxygenase AlkB